MSVFDVCSSSVKPRNLAGRSYLTISNSIIVIHALCWLSLKKIKMVCGKEKRRIKPAHILVETRLPCSDDRSLFEGSCFFTVLSRQIESCYTACLRTQTIVQIITWKNLSMFFAYIIDPNTTALLSLFFHVAQTDSLVKTWDTRTSMAAPPYSQE